MRRRSWPLRALRKLGLGLLLALVVIAVLVIATLDVLRRPGGLEFLRQQALRQTRTVLPGLSVERIAGNLTSTLTLNGVVLNDRFGGPAIRVRRIGLRYDLSRLISGVLRVEQLELDQPEVQVRPSRNGATNLSQLVTPTAEPASKPTSLRLDVERLKIRGGKVSVVGRAGSLVVDPLDGELGLTGSLRDITLELHRLVAGLRLPAGRRFRGSLDGRLALDAKRLEARIAARAQGLTPSGELALEVRAKGPPSHLQLETRLDLAGHGVVSIDGWAGIDGTGRPGYALKARLTAVSLDQVVPALRPTRLGLELEASGAGVPLQPGSRSKLALRMPRATVRGLRVDGITMHARTRGGRWSLQQLQVKAAGGEVMLSGKGTLDHIEATARVDLPRLDQLPAAVWKLGVPRLGGSVKLSARVQGPVKGPLTLRATARLQRVALAALRLGRAELSANLHGLPTAPSGRLEVLLKRLDIGDAHLRVDRAKLEANGNPRGFRLLGEVRGPSLRGRVAAHTNIAAGGERIEVSLLQLELAGLGQRVTLRNKPRIAYERSRVDLSPTRLALLGGEVVVSGAFQPRGFPRLVASLKVDGVRMPGFPHAVQASVKARADRREVQASVRGTVPSLGSRIALETRLPVRYRGTMPALDLRRDGELKLRASGLKLALLGELRRDLPPASGDADLALDLKGPLRDPQLRLTVELTGAGLGELQGVGGTTQIAVTAGRTTLRQRASLDGRPLLTLDAEVPLGLGPLLQRRVSLESQRELPLDLHLVVLPTALSSLRLHPLLQRIAGAISARVDLTGTLVRPRLQLQTRLAAGVVDGIKLGVVDVAGQVTAGDKDLRVSLEVQRNRKALLGAQGSAGLHLEALLRRSPEQAKKPFPPVPIDLVVRFPGYPLDRLASLSPGLQGLRGKLSGKVHLFGDVQAPRGRVSLQLRRVQYSQASVGDLSLGASFDGKRLETRFELRQPQGGQLRGEARLPLFAGRGLDGFVRGKQLDLSFLSRLSPAIRESAGKLRLDVRATGSLDRPVLTGQVALEDGRLQLRGVSLLHHLHARVDLEPERVRLTSLAVQADRGQLALSGQVQLSGRGFDLSRGPELWRRAQLLGRAKGFGLDAGGIVGVAFSGAVKIDGRLDKHTLAVKVSMEDGVVKMPKLEGQRQTHPTTLPSDVVFVDGPRPSTAAARRAASPSPLGLRVDLWADPLFVRGPELNLELANDLHLRTDRKGRPRVTGKVEIRRGRIRALNNTFEVRRATVSFSGEVSPDPALNILLERAAPEALVLVQVTGTARAPRLTLRSDPPIYDQSQIISLLLTGRVDSRPESGGDRTTAITSAISQALLGGIIQRVAPRVGIDVARVSFEESKDKTTGESQLRAETEVGRYLTERLYVAYRRVFGASSLENTNEGLLEYRISSRWLLMLLFGDAGVGGVDLLWSVRH